MRKYFSLFLAAVLFCTLPAGGKTAEAAAAQNTEEEESPYGYYEINSSETDIQRVSYDPQEETADFMIPDLMARMNDKNSSETAIRLLPDEVQMDSYEIAESVLMISFNHQYSNMSRAREVLVRAGIVRTFVCVPGIEAVRFFVGGEELTDSRGEPLGEMTEGTFVSLSGTDSDAYRYDTFTLYFTDSTGTKLVEEERSVYYRGTLPRERVILEQLARGPLEKGHYPTIPEDSGIISVSTADRVCYVNLSENFVNGALDVDQEIPVYSVVNSLLTLENADKVQILIDGADNAVFGEDMQLYNFYEWNEDLMEDTE